MTVSNIRVFLFGVACVLCFFLGKGCQTPCPKGEVVTVHTVDSLWLHDTVKVAVQPVKQGHGVYVPVHAPVSVDSAYDYVSTFDDSLLSVTVTQRMLGLPVDSTRFDVKWKKPYQIIIHDSTVVSHFVPVTRKMDLYGGVVVRGDFKGTPDVHLCGAVRVKGALLQYGYDPFNNRHLVGVLVRLGRR